MFLLFPANILLCKIFAGALLYSLICNTSLRSVAFANFVCSAEQQVAGNAIDGFAVTIRCSVASILTAYRETIKYRPTLTTTGTVSDKRDRRGNPEKKIFAF